MTTWEKPTDVEWWTQYTQDLAEMDIENYQMMKNPQLYEKHDISYYFLSSVYNKNE